MREWPSPPRGAGVRRGSASGGAPLPAPVVGLFPQREPSDHSPQLGDTQHPGAPRRAGRAAPEAPFPPQCPKEPGTRPNQPQSGRHRERPGEPHAAHRYRPAITAPIITFLSDYGPGDEYAGVVVATIATIAPNARVIELGHGVPPQDVRTGARRLARALPFTPAGIHLAVVDPGVGGPRRAVAIKTRDRVLVGPDNGLLVPAAERFGGAREAVDIGNSRWRREPVSATFHGRDIFAPVAAHLANGAALREAGTPIDPKTLVRLPDLEPRTDGAARIVHVVEVDGFGNVITNAALPEARHLGVAGRDVTVGTTFGDVPDGELVLYTDSAGDVALACNGGSAAALLNVRTGDELRLEPR